MNKEARNLRKEANIQGKARGHGKAKGKGGDRNLLPTMYSKDSQSIFVFLFIWLGYNSALHKQPIAFDNWP